MKKTKRTIKVGNLVCLKTIANFPTTTWNYEGDSSIGEMTKHDIGLVIALRNFAGANG